VIRPAADGVNLTPVSARVRPPAEAGLWSDAAARPRVAGKFIEIGGRKFYVKGVTYGTFRPGEDGAQYPAPAVVDRDFAQMAEHGINAVRVYTEPPRWLLDTAWSHGLRVMVGLPWEQHVAFLDDRPLARGIEARMRAAVRACAGHPAVLCYVLGNEIPSSVVRWHGRRRIEAFIERLYDIAKAEDPEGLVTYASFPTTEFLCLPFLDLICFNVYLETEERLDSYLARLHNVAGDRPLIMGEVGLDSRRNGYERQAETLEWQVSTAFSTGCAGIFLFSWTDEWYRGGAEIEDWDFGLTDRLRKPKPALEVVRRAFVAVPFASGRSWPRISVVVCTYNGSVTLRDCLEGLRRLEYPDYEVIVVDDGSTDASAAIAAEYDVRLIRTPNNGLSHARNRGLEAATGSIVAYTDDDARPDPHWLNYLATAFERTDYVGLGGPNIPSTGDGLIADCVANAPGGPIHVLVSDHEAEHIPGCNMAFRREALEAIGGFDPQFREAGDDVDLCWRLQAQGWKIGFVPAGFVWHHRRNSLRTYWRQQKGYGKAEALLERKWPDKYNAVGHLTWAGRLYGHRLDQALVRRRGRIYQGVWGTALFQSIYQPAAGLWRSIPLMPEWFLVIGTLAAFSALGLLWKPLLAAGVLLAVAIALPLAQAVHASREAVFPRAPRARADRLRLHGLTAALHVVQPLARLIGRLGHGLSPWRLGGGGGVRPWIGPINVWSERWHSAEDRLRTIEAALRERRTMPSYGGDWDSWDFEVRGGVLASTRVLMAVEEHGGDKQLTRVRCWPRFSLIGVGFAALLGLLATAALLDGASIAAAAIGSAAVLLGTRAWWEAGSSARVVDQAVSRLEGTRISPGDRLRRMATVAARAAEARQRWAAALHRRLSGRTDPRAAAELTRRGEGHRVDGNDDRSSQSRIHGAV
jgi:O-antigen biosynthesis protein